MHHGLEDRRGVRCWRAGRPNPSGRSLRYEHDPGSVHAARNGDWRTSERAAQDQGRGCIRRPRARAPGLLHGWRQHARGDRPVPLRGDPGRHHHRRELGAGRRCTGQLLAVTGGQLPTVASVAAVGLAGRSLVRRRGRGQRGRPDPAPVRRGRRGAAGAARPVRRGRHDSGPAGDGRRALRRGRRARQRGQHGQGVHEPGLRGQGPAGRAVRRDPASATGPGEADDIAAAARTPRQARARRHRRARLAAVRQASPGRLEHRHVQGA